MEICELRVGDPKLVARAKITGYSEDEIYNVLYWRMHHVLKNCKQARKNKIPLSPEEPIPNITTWQWHNPELEEGKSSTKPAGLFA